MSSIREQLILAAVAALVASPPAGVPAVDRSRGYALEVANLPSGVVVPLKEEVDVVGGLGGPIVKRRLRVAIVWRGFRAASPATAGPDTALDAALNWGVKTLVGSNLGGLAMYLEEVSTSWEYEQGEKFFCKAVQEFEVHYTTRVADAEQRV